MSCVNCNNEKVMKKLSPTQLQMKIASSFVKWNQKNLTSYPYVFDCLFDMRKAKKIGNVSVSHVEQKETSLEQVIEIFNETIFTLVNISVVFKFWV